MPLSTLLPKRPLWSRLIRAFCLIPANAIGCRLFFDRFNADGSPRGRPVPVSLALEGERWRARMGTY